MARKYDTGKNPTCPNQPPSQEFKDSIATSKRSFELPFDFITSQHTGRYPLDIPTPTILDLTYTSSPNTPTQHQDSCSNEEIRGVTPKEALYHVPNTEFDQLHHHT